MLAINEETLNQNACKLLRNYNSTCFSWLNLVHVDSVSSFVCFLLFHSCTSPDPKIMKMIAGMIYTSAPMPKTYCHSSIELWKDFEISSMCLLNLENFSHPFCCKVRYDDRWNETACGSDEVDDAIKWTGIVGRQVLWILQVCHRRGAVKAKW